VLAGAGDDRDGRAVRIGFIGLGNMGGPMAANLLAAGHDVRGFDVAADRLEALRALGGSVAPTAAAAATDAEVVCVAVLDGAQLVAVTEGDDGVLAGVEPGTVVAVHSTVHPDSVRRLAQASPAGVDVLDAPISGGVGGAREGSLAIMVGGPHDAYERAQPAFAAMGTLVVRLGPLGAGLAAKLARNLVGYVSFLAAQEGGALADAAGVDREVLLQILEHTGALSTMMRNMLVTRGGDETYSANLQPLIELAAKDLEVTLEFARSLGIDLPATTVTLEHVGFAMGGKAAVSS
jgi:3-hydroxyisobutyrate dehydrogenase-like beta-hydroxyacid dehydrogenase